MAIGLILLNAALATFVVLTIAGGIVWAIATQHRDHRVASAGPLLRRRISAQPARAGARGYRPQARSAW